MNNLQAGFASLPTVAALIILLVTIGIGVTAITFNEAFISAGQAQTEQAYLYAESGARDALLRIVRNKNYTCSTTDCYSLDFVTNGCSANEGCARVSVSAGVGTSGDPKIIISKGRVKNKTRKVQVTVIYDSSSHGEIASATWQELTN